MSHAQAIQGGIQAWSVAAPYPFLVMAIDNPTGFPQGLYWYVVDTRKGSTDFKDRIGSAHKGKLACEWAGCHAAALYLHAIQGESITDASEAYAPYWAKVREAQAAGNVGALTTG